jgi:hypothetical protein
VGNIIEICDKWWKNASIFHQFSIISNLFAMDVGKSIIKKRT